MRIRTSEGITLSGSLFQRKGGRYEGRWMLDYVADDGRKSRVTAPRNIRTKVQAQAWAQAYVNSDRIRPRRRVHTGPTVADIATRWMTIRRQQVKAGRLAKSTVKDNWLHLKNHILPALGDLHVAELDVPLLRRWVREFEVASQTQRNIVSTLASMIDDAIGEGWIQLSGNPARERSLRMVIPARIVQTYEVVIPEATMSELINDERIPAQRRVRYALAAFTGMRDGELAGLDVDDVDLEARVISITKSFSVQLELGRTKTQGSVRVVPIDPRLATVLRWWLSFGLERWTTRRPGRSMPLLPNSRGERSRPHSAKGLRGDMETIGVASSTHGHDFRFHDIRKSFATWLRAADVPLETIGAILGHEGKSVTSKHYAKSKLAELISAVSHLSLTVERARFTEMATDQATDHVSVPITKTPVFVAPPARVELAANGLGNRCSIH